MKSLASRIAILSARIIIGALGFLILITLMSRIDPWYMDNVVLKVWPVHELLFHIPIIELDFAIPDRALLLFVFAVFPIMVLFSRTGRDAILHLAQRNVLVTGAALTLSGFSLSLLPGFSLPDLSVRSVVVYLLLGLYGVVFLLWGVYPLVTDMKVWERLRVKFFAWKLPYFLGVLFFIEFFLTNWISYFVFEHIPHIQDSIAQVFHGMIFALGKLTVPSPPMSEFFDFTHIINIGRWYSQYPPGHSFLMMLGVLANAPWIVNPLIGSLTIVLFYFLGKELYGDAVGRIAALLGLFSPFILFMSSEFMNHTSALFFFSLFVLFFARTVRTAKILPAVLAGVSLGWLVNIRPFSAGALALPFFVYGAQILRSRFSSYKVPLLAFGVTLFLFVCILLGFNYLTNGHPFLFGYQVLYGEKVMPGFGRGAWGDPHTPAHGIHQTLSNFVGLNKYLFEWPIPSLVFVMILFASMKINRWDVLLLLSLLSLAFSYLLYWFQDWCFGPRFIYEATCGVILLTARGMVRLPYVVKNILGRSISVRRIYGLTICVVLFCTSVGLLSNIPALVRVYSSSYWSVNGKVLKAVQQRGLHKAIIFTKSYYGSVVTANSPLLERDVIYVRNLDDLNKQFMDQFPGYRYYLAQDDRIVEIRPR
jgi:hypothetical protein